MPDFDVENAEVLLIRPNGEQVVLQPARCHELHHGTGSGPGPGPARSGDRRRRRRLPEASARGVVLDLMA